MFRIVSLLLLSIVLILPTAAHADGKAFGGKFPHFKTLDESEQVAAIAHHEGIQRMMIAVGIKMKREDKGLWILPIPAAATEVTVDLLDAFPRFDGEDPKDAVWNLKMGFMVMRLSQIWFAVPEAIFTPNYLGAQLQVHGQSQKWGIHSEVIETSSKFALLDYIHSRDIELVSKELDSFDPYFNGEFSFVATWIDSFEEVETTFPIEERSLKEGRWPSLMVTFPTEQIFYPMLASKREEQENMPNPIWIRLAILGHVREQSEERLRPIHQYMIQKEWPGGVPQEFTAGLATRNIAYTVVWNHVSPAEISRDYIFSPHEPAGMDRAIHIWKITNWFRHPVSFVMFFAMWSVVCASISGWTLFGDWRKMAWVGLWNLGTIVGLSFALMFQGHSNKDRWRFLIRFSLLFVFGSLLIQIGLIVLIESILP